MLAISTAFFIISNLVVTPFYALIVAAPRAAVTRRVLGSLWPVALPAGVHVAFIGLILLVARPDVLALWRSLYVEQGMLGAGTVTLLSTLYGQFPEYATLHGWVHVVVGDVFMARWTYLDGLERAAPGWVLRLTAALTVFMGPVGVVVYLLLRPRHNPQAAPAA